MKLQNFLGTTNKYDWKQIAADQELTRQIQQRLIDLNLLKPPIDGKFGPVSTNLKQTDNNQPINDLQPYLGERGHLVILKQSSSLTKADYIHAHAMKDTPVGQVSFMTSFPTPGKYKIWGQFNRNGKIAITDFWVNVL